MTAAEFKMIIKLAWRSLWRHRRRTIITVSSVAFGLTLAIFFLALGEGGYRQLINDGVRINAGHVTLEHRTYREAPAIDLWIAVPDSVLRTIERLPEVRFVKSVVIAQGVAKSATGAVGLGVMGVDPALEARESPLAEKIIDGRYLAPDDTAKVVIGSGLAERLNLKVGRKLAITSADVNGDLVEELCRVAGIFETGADEMDEFLLQAPLALVRRMFRMSSDGATQVGIVLTDNRLQQQAFDTIAALAGHGDIVALPWQKVLPELDAYVKLDRGSNIVFHGILIFLILFTILNTLMMSTMERETEFAMLLALGESVWRLRLQTLLEAIGIGLLGSLAGVLIGGAFALMAQHWGIDITGLYGEGVSVSGFAFSTRIHAFLDARIVYYSTLIIFASTVVLSVITMRHIGRRSLVDILR